MKKDICPYCRKGELIAKNGGLVCDHCERCTDPETVTAMRVGLVAAALAVVAEPTPVAAE